MDVKWQLMLLLLLCSIIMGLFGTIEALTCYSGTAVVEEEWKCNANGADCGSVFQEKMEFVHSLACGLGKQPLCDLDEIECKEVKNVSSSNSQQQCEKVGEKKCMKKCVVEHVKCPKITMTTTSTTEKTTFTTTEKQGISQATAGSNSTVNPPNSIVSSSSHPNARIRKRQSGNDGQSQQQPESSQCEVETGIEKCDMNETNCVAYRGAPKPKTRECYPEETNKCIGGDDVAPEPTTKACEQGVKECTMKTRWNCNAAIKNNIKNCVTKEWTCNMITIGEEQFKSNCLGTTYKPVAKMGSQECKSAERCVSVYFKQGSDRIVWRNCSVGCVTKQIRGPGGMLGKCFEQCDTDFCNVGIDPNSSSALSSLSFSIGNLLVSFLLLLIFHGAHQQQIMGLGAEGMTMTMLR